jgi:N-acetylglucosamine-6-sulfatase
VLSRRSSVSFGVGILLFAVGVSGSTSATAERATSTRPNIVVIMTDDQTVESLRVMPQVRSLLEQHGVTFSTNIASYPLCCPARTTYYTGQYAHNHHVEYNVGPTGGYHVFHHKKTTVPVALENAGYRTIHIGKYLNGYGRKNPTVVPPGWTDWNGSIDPSTYRYYGFTLNENGQLRTFGLHDYQTDVYTRMAVAKIRREAAKPGPFYLDLAFLAPHAVQRETSGLDPVDEAAVGMPRLRHGIRFPVPPPRDQGRFAGEPLPDRPAFDENDVSDKPSNIQNRPLFPPQEINEIKTNYRRRLETLPAVDRGVAKIIGVLNATKQMDNTVVAFVSDNGFFHGEHRIPYGKYLPYDPSIRVPLIIRGPGFAENETTSALVENVDLPATILGLAGAKPLRKLDGRSLLPLLEDPTGDWPRNAALVESGLNNAGAPVYAGLRTQRYLYVEYTDGQRELYDLKDDPYELRNIAGTRAVRSVQAKLSKQLAKARTCKGKACP